MEIRLLLLPLMACCGATGLDDTTIDGFYGGNGKFKETVLARPAPYPPNDEQHRDRTFEVMINATGRLIADDETLLVVCPADDTTTRASLSLLVIDIIVKFVLCETTQTTTVTTTVSSTQISTKTTTATTGCRHLDLILIFDVSTSLIEEPNDRCPESSSIMQRCNIDIASRCMTQYFALKLLQELEADIRNDNIRVAAVAFSDEISRKFGFKFLSMDSYSDMVAEIQKLTAFDAENNLEIRAGQPTYLYDPFQYVRTQLMNRDAGFSMGKMPTLIVTISDLRSKFMEQSTGTFSDFTELMASIDRSGDLRRKTFSIEGARPVYDDQDLLNVFDQIVHLSCTASASGWIDDEVDKIVEDIPAGPCELRETTISTSRTSTPTTTATTTVSTTSTTTVSTTASSSRSSTSTSTMTTTGTTSKTSTATSSLTNSGITTVTSTGKTTPTTTATTLNITDETTATSSATSTATTTDCKPTVNIVFLIDTSSSIKNTEMNLPGTFECFKNFAVDVVTDLGRNIHQDLIHVAVITFDNDATVQFDFNFFGDSREEIIRKIKAVRLPSYTESEQSQSRLDLALAKVRTELLTPSRGYVDDSREVLLYVITDGEVRANSPLCNQGTNDGMSANRCGLLLLNQEIEKHTGSYYASNGTLKRMTVLPASASPGRNETHRKETFVALSTSVGRYNETYTQICSSSFSRTEFVQEIIDTYSVCETTTPDALCRHRDIVFVFDVSTSLIIDPAESCPPEVSRCDHNEGDQIESRCIAQKFATQLVSALENDIRKDDVRIAAVAFSDKVTKMLGGKFKSADSYDDIVAGLNILTDTSKIPSGQPTLIYEAFQYVHDELLSEASGYSMGQIPTLVITLTDLRSEFPTPPNEGTFEEFTALMRDGSLAVGEKMERVVFSFKGAGEEFGNQLAVITPNIQATPRLMCQTAAQQAQAQNSESSRVLCSVCWLRDMCELVVVQN